MHFDGFRGGLFGDFARGADQVVANAGDPETAALLATALLLTKAEIGVAAGWALFLLRWALGFSVGG